MTCNFREIIVISSKKYYILRFFLNQFKKKKIWTVIQSYYKLLFFPTKMAGSTYSTKAIKGVLKWHQFHFSKLIKWKLMGIWVLPTIKEIGTSAIFKSLCCKKYLPVKTEMQCGLIAVDPTNWKNYIIFRSQLYGCVDFITPMALNILLVNIFSILDKNLGNAYIATSTLQ